MYKVQFKARSPFDAWAGHGQYGTEAQAINAALRKKTAGALLVRVLDKSGRVIYSS